MSQATPAPRIPAAPDPRSPEILRQIDAVRRDAAMAGQAQLAAFEIAGPDAARFLHGQCTQDVKARRENEGGYAFLLDGRGTNLGDLRFVVLPGRILCILDRERLAATVERLARFVVAADARIQQLTDWQAVLVAGPRARALLEPVAGVPLPAIEDHAAAAGGCVIVSDQSIGVEGFLVLGPEPAVSAVADLVRGAGAAAIGPGALEVLRIEAGRPRFGVDLDESVLPEESGQGARAVSYTKGCYVGQEVVAKQKHLGKPRKELAPVLPAGDLSTPAPLISDAGAPAGVVTSCTWSPALGRAIGLAILKAPIPEPGAILRTLSGIEVAVARLPFTSGA